MKRTDTPAFLSITLYCILIASANQCFAGNLNLNAWQDTILVNCPPSNTILADTTDNDPGFWKETYWYDAPNQVYDLSEVAVDLQITVSDACFGSTDNIQYQLLLDLDGDDTLETVINSANLGSAGLGWNKVLFGNATNPNFTGGIPRQFDERQVASNQKYGFALQITQTGQTRTAAVRWNTQADSNAYFLPQLPHGKHKIVWTIEDTCGNVQTCTSNFTIKDTGKPSIQCLAGFDVNIFSTGKIQLWASDFLLSLSDNCTPQDKLMIGLRKSGTGTGFPLEANGNPQTNVIFTCPELGVRDLELWVRDKAGNAGFCTTNVTVKDQHSECGQPLSLRGRSATEADKGVENVSIHIAGSGLISVPYSQFFKTGVVGGYVAYGVGGNQVVITPNKNDNPANGVSTYDLVLISKHILALEALNSPYKIIAADINKSNSVTSFDIVELRKLILGIDTAFQNNTSWRFVEKNYVFPNPLNPFQAAFNEQITLPNFLGWANFQDFVAIKIGDLNGSAITNGSAIESEARNGHTLILSTENRAVKAGETFTLRFNAHERVQAYQFTLNFQNLSLLNVQPISRDMNLGNFGIFEHALTTSYNGAQAGAFELTFRAQADGQISNFLYLSDEITPSAAYQQDQRLEIGLQFNGPTAGTTADFDFTLFQNQPNPFESQTKIGFFLPSFAGASAGKPTKAPAQTEAQLVTLKIFDLIGNLIYTQQAQFQPGYQQFILNSADLPVNNTALLLYQVETVFGSSMKKMLVLK
ncbi:MAG: hypothetical protein NW218_00280 [Saprospiraceae bacterium]|nr:hypothetical protein [Saprospiraceae bacterium]